MTSTVSVGAIEAVKSCPYCTKGGLPIFPVRYAVARADMGNAPALAKPFGDGVSNVALPGNLARYTMRVLRSGYLYMYDERYHARGWKAYQVGAGGYLYPFNPYIEPPAQGYQFERFSCSRQGDAAIARLITIDDAATAKRVWLGYSDVLWTPDVLAAHNDAGYRHAHMRCIDVAAMRKGSQQPHASVLEKLAEHVAEFAATPAQLVAETTSYVEKYLPTPYKNVRQLLAKTDEAMLAFTLCSPMIREMTPWAAGTVKQTHGPLKCAAWAFAGGNFYADNELASQLEERAAKETYSAGIMADDGESWKPGMVALDDPAGIAMELNGLIQQHTAEFTEESARKWQHDTASTIKMLEHAAINGAIDDDNRHGNSAVYATSKEEAARLMRAAAWGKYAKLMRSETEADEVLADYQTAWKVHENAIGLPALDQCWLAWQATDAFTKYFTHNYDRKNLFSGAAFTEVLGAVVDGLSGRKAIQVFLSKATEADPTSEKNLIARGLALNQDELIRHWIEGAERIHAEGMRESLKGAIGSIYAGWSGLMAGKDPKAYEGISKYVYRMSASVIDKLDMAIGKAWLGHVPQKRMVALLGALAKMENPSLTLIDMHGVVTEAERANILNNAMSKVLGKGAGAESAAARFVKDQRVTMNSLVLVDESKLSAGRAGAVTAETMEQAMVRTAPHLGGKVSGASLSVVGFILTAASCKSAFREFQTAHGSGFNRAAANMLGQVTGLTGSSFDAASAVLKIHSARRMASQFGAFSESLTARTAWLTGAGRILGGFGGIIVGLVGVFQGMADYGEGHTTLGAGEVLSGAFGIIAGCALLFGWTGVGLLVGLVAGLLMLLIGHFKQGPVQNWIEQSKLGDGKLPPYKGQVQQSLALQAL